MLQLSPEKTLPQQVPSEPKNGVKKLVLILSTFTPVTRTREEVVKAAEVGKDSAESEAVKAVKVGKNGAKSKGEYPDLARVPYIRYPIIFRKKSVSALLDLGSKVNAIHPTLAQELGLSIRPTDVEAQKIDGIMLDTYKIVVIVFLVTDKANQVRFFKETFLVRNVSPEIVLEMSFFTLSSTDVDFLGQKLRWRTYNAKKALPTIRYDELVGNKEFTATALDPEHETYVVHVGSVSSDMLPSSFPLKLNIHPFRRPWVSGLIAKKALTKVLAKYLDFADIFSSDLASKLPKHTRINNYAIDLVKSYKQPPYGLIYSLKPVELKTLKVYIETN